MRKNIKQQIFEIEDLHELFDIIEYTKKCMFKVSNNTIKPGQKVKFFDSRDNKHYIGKVIYQTPEIVTIGVEFEGNIVASIHPISNWNKKPHTIHYISRYDVLPI